MTIFIKPEDLPAIEKLAASDPPETVRKRVRLLLLYEAGMKTSQIAEKVELSPGRVLYWRRQYLKDGLGVFGNALEKLGEDLREGKVDKESKRIGLGKLTRLIREAARNGQAVDARLEELKAGIARAERRRKKLRKLLKQAKKKKAARARDRLKNLNRRIKRAKKTLKELTT